MGDTRLMDTYDLNDARRALAAVLRAEKAVQQLTNAEIAERSGIAVNTVSNYLNGATDIGWPRLVAIAGALGAPVEELTAKAARMLQAGGPEPDGATRVN